MISLFTGMPGAGKTAAMIDLVRDIAKDRPLFVHFDPSERLRPEQKLLSETLKLPHTQVNASTWHEEVPDGGILIIDEAQGCWRPRGPSAKVPEAIAALETHRHAGVDIFITTQAPRLIDANVRGLVGRHVHIRDTGWLGRWWYEWPETNESLTWKTCPVKKRYKLPKQIFDLYGSANVHTTPVRMAPKTLVLIAVLLVCLAALVFMIVRSVNRYTSPDQVKEPAPVSAPAPAAVRADLRAQIPTSVPDERVDFMPRLSDRPWTAPAYDHLRQVIRMPVITGAVCVNEHCVCYHGQERLDVGSDQCRHWAVYRPFNPYVGERDSIGGKVEASRSSAPDQTLPVHGETSAAAQAFGVGHALPF
ncbi:zonular occludens toxin domain-containing protein [Simplicispira metamorpha]|uniref:Zona occludens toxin n=1 Tax=Simplicispira metamorpha TaxID=80881 RepID=A0A4R2NB28_9BURK|nr:zonular occludens toxin domain-containing protein [Simplicispira metamorpha]TCP18250.1 zona occludens toxin [Simplicispira metamorpha]